MLRACETPEHAMWTMCQRTTVAACVQFWADVCAATTTDEDTIATPALDATPQTARLLLTALLVHVHPDFLDDASGRAVSYTHLTLPTIYSV